MTETKHIVVPPQSGRAVRVKRGARIRITDPQGQQVADFWAFDAAGELDWLSTSETRDITERLFPAVGDHFYSQQGEPMLTLVEDASSGPHDMLFPPCNPALYRRAGRPNHPNCRDNMLAAARVEGLSLAIVPDPVNFFQNSLPQPDGRLDVFASINPPGGYVVLEALQDLTVVVTACSVDHHPTNGDRCTEIEIAVSTPAPAP